MRKLSTHVLDLVHGGPAEGMAIELFREGTGGATMMGRWWTNRDGRTDEPLLTGDDLIPGQYELFFGVGDYFRKRGVNLPDPPFLDLVSIRFGVSPGDDGYHVPLLCSPWAYSTYRGS
ncbi:MAG: hydroxyisourate hydrolase [Candidatus Methylacidiphilales bacterium]